MSQLKLGYPRFFYHPLVEQACELYRAHPAEHLQIYGSYSAAERCRDYLISKKPEAKTELRAIEGQSATVIAFPEECSADAIDFWQHAGEGISSRWAEALLNQSQAPDATVATKEILERLASYMGTTPDHIYLFPSGMAAIYMAFRIVQILNKSRPTVQFSFPYGDTLKLQEKLGNEAPLFYPRGNTEELDALGQALKSTPIGGLFCEFPTNPLLTCVDLPKLRELADTHQFPIIIDETLGACINQQTLPYSDISVISLTKYFSGTSDVMGGALIINPEAPFANQFAEWLKTLYEPETFHPADLIQLASDSTDCRERVIQINRTALEVCEFLQNHPAVKEIFYPSITNPKMYDRVKRPDGGYGGLFSFVLKAPEEHTEAFYDALEITKGPNLGASFSLCCPFTLIAHYNELDWAESAGASRYLIRISVGLEPADELIARLSRAFDAAFGDYCSGS